MDANQVVVQGVLGSDGRLTLNEPVPLPPGAVEVAIQPVRTRRSSPDSFRARIQRMWEGQKARGHVPRSKQEIDAQVAAFRDEAEKEILAVEFAHEECRQGAKRQGTTGKGTA
jgi:hypothetical protein